MCVICCDYGKVICQVVRLYSVVEIIVMSGEVAYCRHSDGCVSV